MSAHELMRELNAAGAALTVCGQYLDVDAPAEVLSEAMLARLKHHKPELLRLLGMRTEPCGQGPEPGRHGVPVDHEGLPVGPCRTCDGLSFWRATRDDPWRCIACLDAEGACAERQGGRVVLFASLVPAACSNPWDGRAMSEEVSKNDDQTESRREAPRRFTDARNLDARNLNARTSFYLATVITPVMVMQLANIGSQYLGSFYDASGAPAAPRPRGLCFRPNVFCVCSVEGRSCVPTIEP